MLVKGAPEGNNPLPEPMLFGNSTAEALAKL